MNNNNSYWEKRKAQRMWEYMQSAENTAAEIAKVYYHSSQYINHQLSNIFNRYAAKHKLTKYEAKKLLNSLEDPTSYSEMLVKLKTGVNTDEKSELIKMLETPAYRVRIRRLEELQNEIDVMVKSIYAQEKDFSTLNYINTSYDAYYKSIYDIQNFTGYAFGFDQLNITNVDQVLNSRWSGLNYSDRIWNNTQALANGLKEQLLIGMLTGKTESEMAKELANKFSTSAFNARRLIRTESNYIAEELEAQSYEECGAKKYIFLATLDLKTSEVCREHDLKKYLLKERKVGVNCPPMHVWCRSTTIIELDQTTLDGLKRRARDPDTGKSYLLDNNLSYKDWLKEQEDKYGVDSINVMQKKIKNLSIDKKQFEQYHNSSVSELIPKTVDGFQDLKYNNSEKFSSIKDRKTLYNRALRVGKLPNYQIASTPQSKVQKYLLNSNHIEGKHKANVFNKRLGYHYENWDKMANEIFKEVAKCPADNKRETKHGTKYDVPMILSGIKGKSLKIKSTWQIDRGSNIPRLITTTFYKKKKG